VQISSLQSSQSLTIHLRTCPRHVSQAEWHRHSMSTEKVRRILSEVASRYLLQVARFAQVANDPGLKVRAGGAGASGTWLEHPRLQINLTRIFL
jgi:hypothetical protein